MGEFFNGKRVCKIKVKKKKQIKETIEKNKNGSMQIVRLQPILFMLISIQNGR